MDNLSMNNSSIGTSNKESNIDKKIEQLIITNQLKEIELEELWQLMDDVWDELGCDNQKIDMEKLSLFYNHPIWLLNGLFIEQHELSMQNRRIIADWINSNKNEINSVVDYGGGFGTLARLIAQNDKNMIIDIYEPHPNQLAVEKSISCTNIKFINSLSNQYDCLVSTDVLEHVTDPLSLFAEMIGSVKVGGYLIIVNCFYPVIKCHLPTAFHFRYTFKLFAQLMGLDIVEKIKNTPICIYKKSKSKSIELENIRNLENISKYLFPLLRIFHIGYRNFKKNTDKNYAEAFKKPGVEKIKI
ncbi:class I SAM-dependent methyltransferase [Brunnivagina elsteri]|uniref:Methyltransferase type 11 domain-containing protein n=1 Tax=Brunnivagina elsteri CCALA 953 TaxID=987040 RepID=A0A2A2TNK5_9CYAN|nr:methyltransferase domain-containing protein [Calothrix elsteri]PAX60059.1 hypothetical protein CK510_03840 [Calothrix elsteri CCALA 953]